MISAKKTCILYMAGESYLLDEKEAKILSRALELMYISSGNRDMVMDMLFLETAESRVRLSGAVIIAEQIYAGASYNLDRWLLAD